MKKIIYLILKTTGDDGSDITGCLLAISAAAMTGIQKFDRAADELSNAWLAFNALSFTINGDAGDLAGLELFWVTDSEWEERFDVAADDDHAFIKRSDFERLKETANPDWRIGNERIVFNAFGDCFIEGSYEDAHGSEESAMLPISEIEGEFSK